MSTDAQARRPHPHEARRRDGLPFIPQRRPKLPMILILAGILLATLLSLFFSTLAYALRDYSRAKLEDYLARFGRSDLLDKTVDCSRELIFITGVCRVIANMLIVVFSFRFFEYVTAVAHNEYLGTIITSTVLTFLFS